MGQAVIAPSRQLIVGGRGFRKPARPVLDPNHPINRGLLHYWHLEGYPAQNAAIRDYGPLSSKGTPTQNAGNHQGAGHHSGTTLLFDSTGTEYVTFTGSFPELSGLSGFTLTTWIKTTANSADYSPFFAKQSDPTNNDLSVITGGAGLTDSTAAAFVIRNGGDTYGYTGANAIVVGTWSFLAFVFDGSQSSNAGRMKIYHGASSVALNFIGTIPATLPTNTIVPTMGAAAGGFKANIDAQRIYNRALSVSEILRLYAEPYAGIVEQAPRQRAGQIAGGFVPYQPWYQLGPVSAQ